jgi:uncharacterized protein YecE (DUF72 family)
VVRGNANAFRIQREGSALSDAYAPVRDDTARPAIANFFASGVLALEEKLGPFLWQFPLNYSFEPDRLNRFLALLPRDSREARLR